MLTEMYKHVLWTYLLFLTCLGVPIYCWHSNYSILMCIQTDVKWILLQVRQAILGAHGPAAQRSGIALLEALVSEFAPSTASAMGLPAEVHEHCRASLELDYLHVQNFPFLVM